LIVPPSEGGDHATPFAEPNQGSDHVERIFEERPAGQGGTGGSPLWAEEERTMEWPMGRKRHQTPPGCGGTIPFSQSKIKG